MIPAALLRLESDVCGACWLLAAWARNATVSSLIPFMAARRRRGKSAFLHFFKRSGSTGTTGRLVFPAAAWIYWPRVVAGQEPPVRWHCPWVRLFLIFCLQRCRHESMGHDEGWWSGASLRSPESEQQKPASKSAPFFGTLLRLQSGDTLAGALA